jgi:tetratricopeptide (TPR) repeat protein/tRNA A-37 threonylcarbamoyl transferase component Bud32
VGTSGVSDRPLPEAIHVLCDRFEAAWKSALADGARPSIEDHLAEVPEADRPLLLRELIVLELYYRAKVGEQATAEDYLERFPLLDWRWLDRKIPPEQQTSGVSPPEVSPPTAGGVPVTRVPGPVEAGTEAAAPSVVPGYAVLGLLGRGGMGVVYKARQTKLNRIVALKMMLHHIHASRDARRRFRAEAMAVAQLQHPNVIQIFDVGEHEGLPFFSLEYCPGGSLEKHLNGTPWPAEKAAGLGETLARAMHAAHRAGIVHRDLKPGNVLLAADGQPKITDFGLAKKLDEAGKTGTGAVMGTPDYMAPEQAAGKTSQVGPPADVYALGAILYELLTGRPPFRAETPTVTLQRVIHDEPVSVRRLNPAVPRDLETVCHKCLEKAPGQRYASAEALAEDLRRFQAGEPVGVRPAGLLRRTGKWARRRPSAAALLGVLLLTAAGVLGAIPVVFAQLRAAAEVARAEANEERTRRQREEARADAVQWLREGQEAVRRKAVEDARVLFSKARDRIEDGDAAADPDLAGLRDEAGRLLADLERRGKARQDFKAVFRLRDQALFELYRDVFTGTDPSSPARSQEAARKALIPYGVLEGPLKEDDLASLEPDERNLLRVGLYEVSLVLAEALARPRPGQAPEERRRLAAEALAVVNRAGPLAPDARSLHRRRGRYLALKGDEPAAKMEQALAAGAPPVTPVDWFFTGCDKGLDEGDWEQAGRHFDAALRSEPRLFWAHFFRAIAWQKLRQPERAIGSLTACVTERPDFVWTYLLRGSLYGQTGAFQAAADDFAAAERFELDDSARYVLFVNRGFVALRQKDLPRAVAELEKAVPLEPDLYHAHVNLAEAHLRQGQPQAAVKHLDRAIELQPKLASLYRTRAGAHRQQKDWRAALRDLDEAIRLTPAGPRTVTALALDHRDRARALSALHRYPQAVLACGESLALNPGDPIPHRLLGEALLQVDCFEEALAAFDLCSKLDAFQPDADFYRLRARACRGMHDPAGVVQEVSRALLFAPRDSALYAQRGWAHLSDDSAAPLALRDFQEAVRLAPKSGDAYLGRGAARAKLGDYRQAAADVEEALRRGPESWQMHYNAARIFAQAFRAVDDAAPAGTAVDLRTRYPERAADCLRRVLQGYTDKEGAAFFQEQVLRDRAFVSLKGTPAFSRLAGEYARPRR